jgi:hypothetical protein
MTDSVKNMHDILQVVKSQLKADSTTANMRIRIMGQVNYDPALAREGWVGIYMDNVVYEPRTLGAGSENWRFALGLKIIVQASHAADSELAHERLEGYIESVLNTLFKNVTLSNQVEMLEDMSIEYATSEDDASTMKFEGAIISMTFSGRTN